MNFFQLLLLTQNIFESSKKQKTRKCMSNKFVVINKVLCFPGNVLFEELYHFAQNLYESNKRKATVKLQQQVL